MLGDLLQPTHLLLILLICLIVFGPSKLPELGKGLGEGIRGFRDSMKGLGGDSTKSGGSSDAEKK